MTTSKVKGSDELKIDVEIDLGEKGGLLRFRDISALKEWMKEEEEFWGWLKAKNRQSNLPPAKLLGSFFTLDERVSQLIRKFIGEWDDKNKNIENIENHISNKEKDDPTVTQDEKEIDELLARRESLIEPFRNEVIRAFKTNIIDSPKRLTRLDPAAHFIKTLSEESESEAAYALHQILSNDSTSVDYTREEFSGRCKAVMYLTENIGRTSLDQNAFSNMTESWNRELSEYKSDYEGLNQSFEEVSENIGKIKKRLDETVNLYSD